MEEIMPLLKDMLRKAIELDFDDSKLMITLKIKSHVKGNLANLEEIIVMFKMFGKMKEDIPMDVSIHNDIKTIIIKLHNRENYLKLREILNDIWDNAVNMLNNVMKGDFTSIKDIPNIDD